MIIFIILNIITLNFSKTIQKTLFTSVVKQVITLCMLENIVNGQHYNFQADIATIESQCP